MATATYVYCLVRRVRKPSSSGVPAGVPAAATPELYPVAKGLWLVAASVPLETYGPGALEQSSGDLEWVSRVALAHEATVEHFLHQPGASVVPMKVFTLFTSAQRAASEMRRRQPELDDVLDRVEGCEEWGVRVVRSEEAKPARRGPAPATGTAFLAARKGARDEARAARTAAVEAAQTAFDRLAEIARDGRRRSPDGSQSAAPLLDAAFLVPARRRARFHAEAARAAREIARHGAQMTLTGPWPPYNFVAGDGR